MKRLCIIVLAMYALYSCKSTKPVPQKQKPYSGQITVSGDTVKAKETLQLPVFIPISELQNQLYQQFFAPTYGKYFPCQNQDCGDAYKDLYVSEPFIHVKDSMITIKMHLGGVAHVLLSFEVSADLLLTAQPMVKNDTLYFKNVTMQPSSQNIITAITTSFFGQKIVDVIQRNAFYSFRPRLDATAADMRKKFPLKWGNICLLLNLNRIFLNNVTTRIKPVEGIIANFAAEMTIESGEFCGQ